MSCQYFVWHVAQLRLGRLGKVQRRSQPHQLGRSWLVCRTRCWAKARNLKRGIDDHHRQTAGGQSADATTVSKPPVASIATIFGDKASSRTMRSSIPTPVRFEDENSRRSVTNRHVQADPLKHRCQLLSRPSDPILAQSGFGSRRKRLFGFDGTAGDDPPRSPYGLSGPWILRSSHLPPRRLRYQKRGTSSYKDFWLIVAFQGASDMARPGSMQLRAPRGIRLDAAALNG